MIIVTLKLPKDTDLHYRKEAKRRGISKGAVLREVLMAHEQEEKKQRDREASLAA